MDASDFAAFCETEFPSVVGLLSLYCGNADLAEELAQEAITRACRDWKKLRRAASARAWVQKIGINLANSHFRRKAAEQRATERLGARPEYNEHEIQVTDRIAVRLAVARLPRRQKTALVLRYYADLPVGEVAELMACPEGTVKTLVHRAIKALRSSDQLEELKEVLDAEVVGY